MKRKRLVSLFYFNDNIAGKDMFLAPKYLAEALDMDCEIVFPKWKENEHLRGEYRGVKLTPIRSKSQFHSTFWTEKAMLWWLIYNAHRIDVLSLFWLNPRNMVFALVYKLFNPRGICWVKGDVNEVQLSTINSTEGGLNWRIKKFLHRGIDIITAETKRSVELIENGVFGSHLSQKVLYMPNAFDTELFENSDIVRRRFEHKENLIITVGRIGHSDKNSKMVLEALDGVDMRGWEFLFVGPIEPEFRQLFDNFIVNNPDKRECVKLQGAVNKKAKLWEIYNRAKVFVLTSPKEGFPNVFPEALQFGNYIITTAVASSIDVTNGQACGAIVPVGDTLALKEHFGNLFNGKLDLANFDRLIAAHSKQFEWNNTVTEVATRVKEIQHERNN